ncbi:MAG: hypothetical protein QMC05_05305 [Pseudomonadales bacterium]|jgi:hypothetical protein|tara:strand:- start:77 stop:697 length:621 start_codon:yes stop_codon:yes gene_type:complete
MNISRYYGQVFGSVVAVLLLASCTAKQPSNIDNICEIFSEQRAWYKAANKSAKRWGTTIPVMMSVIHQESSFKAKAKPPRTKILWVFPGPRPASAKGYAQAIDGTWDSYRRSTGRWSADRNDFKDASDFIGWYIDQSASKNGIAKTDAQNLYLSYHEGQGGFAKGTHQGKPWLLKVAKKVEARAKTFDRQLKGCERKFKKRFFGLF